MESHSVVSLQNWQNVLKFIWNLGNRPPSANNRVIMNAATGQKIGIGGVGGGVSGVGGLSVASSTI